MKSVENAAGAILSACPDCFKVLSAEGTVRFINDGGLTMMEADSRDQVVGICYPDIWPNGARQRVADAIRNAVNGEDARVEGYCPTLKGTPRWWETNFRAVKSSDQAATEVIAVTRDISGWRARELDLRANEERFVRFVESSMDGVCETNADGRCTFINSAGAAMLGYRKDELIGKSLHPILHHHRADGSVYALEDCPIFKSATSGRPVRVKDEVFWHKDGHAVPTSYSVFPIDCEQQRGGVVLTFSDGTEHRRIETDLQRMSSKVRDAERRTTEFIAILAHELRNPLAPIRTGLQLMQKAGDDALAIADVREMMERQVGQMTHLVSDLLDIARVNSGKMQLNKQHVDLQRVFAAAREASKPWVDGAGHLLDVRLPQETLIIDGDETRLAQIFTNLLNNAAKYTDAGGRISVTATPDKDQVVVEISDSGIGIAPDALHTIFDMFTRVGHPLQGAQGGLGIGLNLVRRLVDLHGGSVVATSGGLGKGSQFSVTLPLVRNDMNTESATSCATPREAHRVRVLLVDDNVDAAVSLSLLLELEEHITRVANNGVEALKLVAEFLPDIVLLDIGMPGMNGYEVARAIRAMPDVGNPVLVALTGWGGESDRLKSKNAGFDEHLTKPADIAVIDKLLAKFNQARADDLG